MIISIILICLILGGKGFLFWLLPRSWRSLNLYKISGAFVFGFVGSFGTGNTLGMLEQGLLFADKYHLKIVTNLDLNIENVKKYCAFKKYNWFFNNGRIILIKDSPLKMLQNQDSLILLDEAGVELFSRNFKSADKQLFDRFFRLRHFGNYLFFTCQDASQIDKQFRQICHQWIYCGGFQRFDLSLRRSKLYSRWFFAFDELNFQKWLEDGRGKFFRSLHLSQWRFGYSNLFYSNIYWYFFGFLKNLISGFQLYLKKGKINPIWVLHYALKLPPLKSPELQLFSCFSSFQNARKSYSKLKLYHNIY